MRSSMSGHDEAEMVQWKPGETPPSRDSSGSRGGVHHRSPTVVSTTKHPRCLGETTVLSPLFLSRIQWHKILLYSHSLRDRTD